ncbi:WxL domain-containing protein [Enterococcus faecalis]|nr:WxL domain-containing protein [Enterococcus faecalis]
MKQIRFKHLATLGVCCSLFSNSLAGVTAVAETMTIESSPTAESTQVEEEEKTEETETQESLLKTAEQKEMSNSLIGSSRAVANFAFPERVAKFQFVDENGNLLNPSLFELTSDFALRTNGSLYNPVHYAGTDVGTTKQIIFPQTSIVTENSPSNPVFVGATDSQVAIPRFAESISVVPPTNYTGNTYVQPNVEQYNRSGSNWVLNATYTTEKLNVHKKDASTYGIGAAPPFLGLLPTESNASRLYYVAATSTTSYLNRLFSVSGVTTLYVTNRKVTESFKNQAGATIPPPPNFEEGRKTSITNNDFTYTQSGTLPKSYKGADGKTYFLKGWYKGKTKPSTLRTDAPSYKVTYDDNDDLTVVYEEAVEKTATIPAITYKFGFVSEKGTLIAPTNFVMQTNLTTVMNATPKQVGTATGVDNGGLKHLTIPSQVLTYTPVIKPAFSGATDFRVTVPRYYKTPTVKPGAYYTGSSTAYPMATTRLRYTDSTIADDRLATDGQEYGLFPTTTPHSYQMYRNFWITDTNKTLFNGVLSRAVTDEYVPNYYTTDDTMYYFLENRRINARYVDQDGNKLTSLPPDVKQDAKTPITSENFTFMHGTTLPDSYKGTDGKTYKFKGWYKGKSKPSTLKTTKQPSYMASYNDDDDLTVVYEATEIVDFPARTYQFGFVGEAGKRVDATKVGLTYDNWAGELLTQNIADWKTVSLEKGQVAPTKNNLKEIVYPGHSAERVSGRSSQFSAANLTFTLPRYYEKMSVYNKQGTFDTAYPMPNVQSSNSTTPIVENSTKNVSRWFELKKSGAQSFIFNETTAAAPTDVKVPAYLREIVYNPAITPTKLNYSTVDKPVYYYLTNRKVTENFIDPAGNKLTSAPTNFKQGQQTAITTDPYTYTSAQALPASYKGQDGKTYIFKGWYKGKTKPSTLKTTKTPSYPVTFDGNDDLNVVYEEGVASVEASMKGTATIIPNGGSQLWNMTLKNTGTAPLTGLKVTPTANWSSGLAAPTQISVKVGTGGYKNIPVTTETWKQGIALNTEIPVGQTATVLFSTTGTGAPLEVLQAAVNITSNAPTATVASTVRIQGADQEVTDPVGEGFISLPTFDFGQVGIAGATTQHGLKKAADYYGNGTRNPFVRIKKSQPNWSLTAQLSQPKSAKDSLPTATRLLLGQAAVSKVDNYNLVTEMLNPVGTTSALSLTANNAVTNVITDKQFTGNDVYNLDFNFNNVKLEVPANQGTKGEQYNATVTWNLVTGP